MIIRCPSCGSTYDISKQPQAAGRKVKCMRCSHVWKAEPVDAAAPISGPRAEPTVAAPPPPPSEIAVPRPPVSVAAMADQDELAEPPRASKSRNGFNGLNGDHHSNGHPAESDYPPAPPIMPAPRRPSDFEDAPPTHRPAAPREADAGYFDEPPPQRPARRPEPQWREPPRESYRDEAYGDFDRGYGQDEFAPTRESRSRQQPPSRGRRAAAIVGWVAYLAAVGALGAYVYTGRDQIVSWLPGAAPYYQQFGLPVNQFGLAFKDVKAEWGKVVDGQGELKISVGVENTTSQPQKVPTIVIGLKDKDGSEMAFRSADADMGRLAAGKSDKFSVTLKVPAQATRAIQVRFATSR